MFIFYLNYLHILESDGHNVKELLKLQKIFYVVRFWILFYTSVSLFISGVICLLLCSLYRFISLIPSLIFIILVFNNLIKVYNLEKRYTKNIFEIMEEL